jgi:TonB family protein
MKPLSASLVVLLVLHTPHAVAGDLPAGLRIGSCDRLKFDVSGVSVPEVVEVLVEVDPAGIPTSARSLTPTSISAFDEAVAALAMSCKYSGATVQGKSVPGQLRFVLPIRQAPEQRPGALPAIGDVKECAPKAEDYPPAALRANQEGTTRIGFTVDEKGQLKAFGVIRSSGHLLLDYTALIKLAGCKFVPGKAPDGTPIGGSFSVEYVWKLQ